MSKTQLAEQLSFNRTTVIDIENGERLPSLEYVYKFSKIFMMPIDKLIELFWYSFKFEKNILRLF